MKKIKLLLLMLFFSVSLAWSKVDFGLQFHGGLSAGRYKNYSFKNGKLSSLGGQLNYKFGGGGGVEARLWLSRFIGLGIGVEINQGGNRRKETIRTGGTQVITVDDRINFLTIPLCLHAGYGNKRLKVYGTAGAYYSYVLNGDYHYTNVQNGIMLAEERGDLDFDSTYTRTDLGLRFGAGIEVFVSDNGKHGITIDLGYDWGLYKVFQQNIEFNGVTYRFTHSRTLVQAGYIVRFGKAVPKDDIVLPEL